MRALQESDEGFAGKNMSACPPTIWRRERCERSLCSHTSLFTYFYSAKIQSYHFSCKNNNHFLHRRPIFVSKSCTKKEDFHKWGGIIFGEKCTARAWKTSTMRGNLAEGGGCIRLENAPKAKTMPRERRKPQSRHSFGT